jgi:hypothetical protein
MAGMWPAARISVVLLLFVASCGGAGSAGAVNHTFQNQGKICLFPDNVDPGNAFAPPRQAVSFQADRPAHITVQAPTCLSSSCSHDPRATCVAALRGNVIEVTSDASYRQEGTVCTDDCGALVADCTTPSLPAGTYQVRHGSQTFSLTIPSMIAPPCAGQAP